MMHKKQIKWLLDKSKSSGYFFWHVEFFDEVEPGSEAETEPDSGYIGIVTPITTTHGGIKFASRYKFEKNEVELWLRHPNVEVAYSDQEKLALQLKYSDKLIN
jgi:hypothetical protein